MAHRPNTLWRYHEMLPVQDPCYRISLGEGGTPVLKLDNLGQLFGLNQLYLKDEGQNPTGSFKALGLAVAVSRALELGAKEFVIPTAGNAGGALAAYCARAGVMSHVFMPQDAPLINILEVQLIGADLRLVNGLINDAGREAAAVLRLDDDRAPFSTRWAGACTTSPRSRSRTGWKGRKLWGMSLRPRSIGNCLMSSSTRPAAEPG